MSDSDLEAELAQTNLLIREYFAERKKREEQRQGLMAQMQARVTNTRESVADYQSHLKTDPLDMSKNLEKLHEVRINLLNYHKQVLDLLTEQNHLLAQIAGILSSRTSDGPSSSCSHPFATSSGGALTHQPNSGKRFLGSFQGDMPE